MAVGLQRPPFLSVYAKNLGSQKEGGRDIRDAGGQRVGQMDPEMETEHQWGRR